LKQAKQISSLKKFKAEKGFILPIFYNNSIIRIGEEPVEIDMSLLKYESEIQLKRALDKKHILEIGDK